MDTGKGYFEQVEDTDLKTKSQEVKKKFPNHGGWFKEGEVVELKGSKFRISKIEPTKLVLKLLPRQGIE